MAGRGGRVMGIEEGIFWDEHWVLYGNQSDNKSHIFKKKKSAGRVNSWFNLLPVAYETPVLPAGPHPDPSAPSSPLVPAVLRAPWAASCALNRNTFLLRFVTAHLSSQPQLRYSPSSGRLPDRAWLGVSSGLPPPLCLPTHVGS